MKKEYKSPIFTSKDRKLINILTESPAEEFFQEDFEWEVKWEVTL